MEMIKLFFKRIFRKDVSHGLLEFIKNLGILSIFFIVAKLFSIPLQILSGRILGSYEYGKFAYIISLSYIFSVVISFGISSSLVKYMAESKEKKEVLSTALLLSLPITTIFLVVFLFFSKEISEILNVTEKYVYVSLFFGFLLYIQIFLKSFFQGIHEYRKIGYLEVIFWISAFISFIVLVNFYKNVYSIIYAYIVAYFIFFALSFKTFIKYLSRNFSKLLYKKMFRYSFYSFISGIFYMWMGNIEKLFLNKYGTLINVGVFQAYYFSTFGIVSTLNTIFVTIYFPEVARRDKKILIKKINKVAKYVPLFLIPIFFISYAIIQLYNFGFYIDLFLPLVFSAVFLFYYALYNTFLISVEKVGIKYHFKISVFTSILNVLLNFILIPKYGLFGAVLSISITNITRSLLNLLYANIIAKKIYI